MRHILLFIVLLSFGKAVSAQTLPETRTTSPGITYQAELRSLDGSYSSILGGWSNHIAGSCTNLGSSVYVNASANYSFIGGGENNAIASANYAGIGAGTGNVVSADRGFIGGGLQNLIKVSGGTSTGACASISGGWNNETSYRFSNIPGGINLTTSAEAQTVLGAGNLASGNGHLIYWTGYSPNDDRVLEIGSPVFDAGLNSWVTHNAFEVSFNGHSIVYHTNGSSMPSAKPVYQGATYVESPVYAWGEFDAAGNEMASFGISQVVSLVPYGTAPGAYLVTLSPADPHGGATPDIRQASVTVTVVNDNLSDIAIYPPPPPAMQSSGPVNVSKPIPAEIILASGGTLSNPDTTTPITIAAAGAPLAATTSCGYATASSIGILGPGYERSFIVRTFTGGTAGCQQEPLSFYLKVCHR